MWILIIKEKKTPILPEEQKCGVIVGQHACCKTLCFNHERTLEMSVLTAKNNQGI